MRMKLFVCLVSLSCAGERPSFLAVTADGEGPQVIYDTLHKPEPELPLPNNVATRLVPHTPTGRLLNLSVKSPIALERKLRRQLNRLDGFSVWAPITVPFDAPLDLKTVTTDTIKMYDVSPESPEYGQEMPLDLGEGHFPIGLKPRAVFPFEAGKSLTNLMYPKTNVVDGELVTHWEVETNTLIMRNMYPLRPKTTYAVVLTKDIKGLKGDSIRSPFLGAHSASQTDALSPVVDWIEGGAKNIAFAWTFTTQSTTDDLEHLRDGLDGKGSLAWLKDKYPGGFADIVDLGLDWDGDGSYADKGVPEVERDHRYILQPKFLDVMLAPFVGLFPELASLKWDHVDYAVFGSLAVPDFRSDEDRSIWVNAVEGHVDNRPSTAPFALVVPKTTEEHKPPFPVIVYSHGARTSRFELLILANDAARHGFAVAGIDAAGHGPFGGDLEDVINQNLDSIDPVIITFAAGLLGPFLKGPDYDGEGKSLTEILTDFASVGLWRAIFVDGRSEDLDGDGQLASGDGYFVGNPFELNSNARQTVLDTMMLYRTLTRFNPTNIPSDPVDDPRNASDELLKKHMMAGDFNADGKLDIGGPDNRYFAMGTSLGGIHTSVLMAVEPGLKTGAPVVSGGGMSDIMVRTTLANAVDAIFAEAAGPAIVGCPVHAEGETPTVSLSWNNWSMKCSSKTTIANAELMQIESAPGGTVTLENLRLLAEGGEAHEEDARHTSPIRASGGFSVTVAADEGDTLILTLRNEYEEIVGEPLEFEAARGGLGRLRNTPRFRQMIQLGQTAMDRADPIAFARHLIREPLEGMTPRNVLHLCAIGDRTVPFVNMVAWDRAVGLLGLDQAESLTHSDNFLGHNALDGVRPYWDIDGHLLGEQCDPDKYICNESEGPLPLIQTSSGVSATRYMATDKHEFIALPDKKAPIDWATYSRNQALWFFATEGQEIVDKPCLGDNSCDFLPGSEK